MKKKNIHEVNLEQRIGNRQDSIFFIESNDKLTEFRPRLLCAFESAAMQNPDKMVYHLPILYSQIRLMVPRFCPPNIETITGLSHYPIVIY